jgi:hypothetical protein
MVIPRYEVEADGSPFPLCVILLLSCPSNNGLSERLSATTRAAQKPFAHIYITPPGYSGKSHRFRVKEIQQKTKTYHIIHQHHQTIRSPQPNPSTTPAEMYSLASLLPVLSVLATIPFTSASPTPRQSGISATFIGAANAQFTVPIPQLSTWTPTNNVLSISHIQTSAGSDSCTFFGIDGAVVVLPQGGGFVDVGPPQTIVGGICGPFPGQSYGMW